MAVVSLDVMAPKCVDLLSSSQAMRRCDSFCVHSFVAQSFVMSIEGYRYSVFWTPIQC